MTSGGLKTATAFWSYAHSDDDGADVHAVLSCAYCGEPISRNDIVLNENDR